MNYRDEPLEITDIYEDDEIVVVKVKYDWFGRVKVCTDVGLKNEDGDIIRSETVKSILEEPDPSSPSYFYKIK